MADPVNPFGPTTETTAEKLRKALLGLEQIKKMLTTTSPGTKEYANWKKKYDDAKKYIDELNKQDEAERTSSKAKTADGKRKKLEEALTRAKDYGSPDEVQKAQQNLDAFNNKNPKPTNGELRYGPNGESLVPGTPGYDQGSPIKPSNIGTKVVTKGTATTSSKISTSTSDVNVTADKNASKTAWISYLKVTFQTLPKDQKDQIDKLFVRAKDEVWDEKTFTEALKGTIWWQSTYPTLRNFFLQTHDPRNAATFAQTLQNQIDTVAVKLEELGVRAQQVDPITGKFYDNSDTIKGIAMDALKNGWNDNQLMQHLGDNAQLLFTGGGTIGSSIDKIKQQALLYGINLDNNYIKSIQYSLLDPTDARDTQYYFNEVKNQAIDLYKPFAESLKSGRSLYEVTNSYRNQMATLLEVDPTAISWQDLMGKVMDNQTGNARTFADFTKQLKNDPLWQYTKNAKETYSNMALDLGKMFGFVG